MEEIKRIAIHAHDEPEFQRTGSGRRRFLMWKATTYVHLLYVPSMLHIKMLPERYDSFKPKDEAMAAVPTANAVKHRREFLQRCGLWDGGKLVEKLITALEGQKISLDELEAIAETEEAAQATAPIADASQLDKEAAEPPKAAAKKAKASEEPVAYEPALKDRVKRSSDKDEPPQLGTIIGVGPEQSAVKWDGGEKEGFELNKWLVKVEEPATQQEVEPMAKKAAKKAAKKNGAKAAPKSARAESNDPIVREFQVAEGSNRHKALKVLRGSLGKNVKVTDVSKAVYGKKEGTPLANVLKGIRDVIAAQKLSYVLGQVEGRGDEAVVKLGKK